MKIENATLKTENAAMKTEIATLKIENATLKTENAAMKTEIADMKTEIATMKIEKTDMKTEIAAMKTENVAMMTEIATLKIEKTELEKRIAALEETVVGLKKKVFQAEIAHAASVRATKFYKHVTLIPRWYQMRHDEAQKDMKVLKRNSVMQLHKMKKLENLFGHVMEERGELIKEVERLRVRCGGLERELNEERDWRTRLQDDLDEIRRCLVANNLALMQ